MMAISLVSSALLLRRGTVMGGIFALVCLAIGFYLSRNFARCTRVMRKIDQGLAPYRIKEKG